MLTRREFAKMMAAGVVLAGGVGLPRLEAKGVNTWETWRVIAGKEGENKLPALTVTERGPMILNLIPDHSPSLATYCFGLPANGMERVKMWWSYSLREQLGVHHRGPYFTDEISLDGVLIRAWGFPGTKRVSNVTGLTPPSPVSVYRITRSVFGDDEDVGVTNWGEETDLG